MKKALIIAVLSILSLNSFAADINVHCMVNKIKATGMSYEIQDELYSGPLTFNEDQSSVLFVVDKNRAVAYQDYSNLLVRDDLKGSETFFLARTYGDDDVLTDVFMLISGKFVVNTFSDMNKDIKYKSMNKFESSPLVHVDLEAGVAITCMGQ